MPLGFAEAIRSARRTRSDKSSSYQMIESRRSLRRCGVEVFLANTITFSPWFTSRRTIEAPINPNPPVTMIGLRSAFIELIAEKRRGDVSVLSFKHRLVGGRSEITIFPYYNQFR